jgi:hypothetical protein
MRRQAAQAGLSLSVRELLSQLAGIGETVLICPPPEGAPGPAPQHRGIDAVNPVDPPVTGEPGVLM